MPNTKITDEGLKHLRGLSNLEHLSLAPQHSDAGLEHLGGLRKLETIKAVNTKVTKAGVAKLQETLPRCQVEL